VTWSGEPSWTLQIPVSDRSATCQMCTVRMHFAAARRGKLRIRRYRTWGLLDRVTWRCSESEVSDKIFSMPESKSLYAWLGGYDAIAAVSETWSAGRWRISNQAASGPIAVRTD
jgi:hypothetical protein